MLNPIFFWGVIKIIYKRFSHDRGCDGGYYSDNSLKSMKCERK